MASRLVVCFGTPKAGLGLYRRLLNQLPFVVDHTEIFASILEQETLEEDTVHADLSAQFPRLAAEPGLHFLASNQLHLKIDCWCAALSDNPGLQVHYVFLVRHPFEVAGHTTIKTVALQTLFTWCLAIERAAYLFPCHLTSFDELLADPWGSLNAFFQTIPERLLLPSALTPELHQRLLAEVQPTRRSIVAAETGLASEPHYLFFSNLYATLQMQRLYRPEQLRITMRLMMCAFAEQASSERRLLEIAKASVEAGGDNFDTNLDFVFEHTDNTEFERSLEALLPKQTVHEGLLKIAGEARKNKQLIASAAIYQFLLMVDSQSTAALAGAALVSNDLKQWGEAIPLWEMLFAIQERDGTTPNVAQRNGRNNSVKRLSGDIGYVLSKPVGDITVLRKHIIQTPGANGHIAFMRTWSYLARTSGALSNALLVNDTRTQTNIGCYTTTNELLRGCHAADIHIDHTITLIELSLLANHLFNPGPLEPDSPFDDYLARFASRPEFHAYRKLIAQHRILIVNGEGSFYDRQRKGLILCILITYAKQYCGCQVYCINHSADLHDELMRRWVYQAYQSCDNIAVREHLSLSRLPGEFSCFDVRLVPDAAYGLLDRAGNVPADLFHGVDQLFSHSISQPFVVVSGTSSIFRADREGFFTHHVLAFNALLRAIMGNGFQVVLLASDNTDYKLLRQAAIELELPLVSPTAQIDAVLSLFRDATAFISGRWHTSIIAACAGCPSILGDANFFKTAALQEAYRYPWPMFNYRNLANDEAKILLAIEHCQSKAMRREVLSKAHASAVQVAEMLNLLKKHK